MNKFINCDLLFISFKWAIPGPFLFIFVFTTNNFWQQMIVKNVNLVYGYLDLNPQPSETTSPGFPPEMQFTFTSWIACKIEIPNLSN